jgi:hypothetical protein
MLQRRKTINIMNLSVVQLIRSEHYLEWKGKPLRLIRRVWNRVLFCIKHRNTCGLHPEGILKEEGRS